MVQRLSALQHFLFCRLVSCALIGCRCCSVFILLEIQCGAVTCWQTSWVAFVKSSHVAFGASGLLSSSSKTNQCVFNCWSTQEKTDPPRVETLKTMLGRVQLLCHLFWDKSKDGWKHIKNIYLFVILKGTWSRHGAGSDSGKLGSCWLFFLWWSSSMSPSNSNSLLHQSEPGGVFVSESIYGANIVSELLESTRHRVHLANPGRWA